MMTRGKFIRTTVCAGMCLTVAAMAQQGPPSSQAKDPGLRKGVAGAGSPVAGLTAGQLQFFNDGQARFLEVDDVSKGLGPTFNSNSCVSCHSQPAIGGSSPVTNPQIAAGLANGASNKIPSFIQPNGPAREVRFKNVPGTNTPDGGVHGVFTIAGRADAPGCKLAQPDFSNQSNMSFRIPTPVFGAGLIESIADGTILANLAANAQLKKQMGIAGAVNTSGNDGTITRFGWKAQNKSMLMFAGEAYNVEVGVSNELFPNKRSLVAGCSFTPAPEDATNTNVSAITDVSSDIVAFALFMRMLDAPQPAVTNDATVAQGQGLFNTVGCALCHTPSMKTGAASIAALSNKTVNLYSDLAIHDMGTGLDDGITQGAANGRHWRTAPLWGLGQRVFFLHDGRTSDLMAAILAHRSQGSEAAQTVNNFSALPGTQQQAILNFLRSL